MPNINNQLNDDGRWGKAPHGFVINDTYEDMTRTIQEALNKESLLHDVGGAKEDVGIIDRALAIVKDIFRSEDAATDPNVAVEKETATAKYLNNQFTADTSVGGMDCINPHWQFGIDDDIRHQALRTDKSENYMNLNQGRDRDEDVKSGLGRVYHEMYYLNQKNLYMSFGIPQFYGIKEFFKAAVDPKTADLHNQGGLGLFSNLSKLIKEKALSFDINIASMQFSLNNLGALIKSFTTNRVNKYYGMKPSMPIYYRMVNSLLSVMAVNMNLYPDAETYKAILDEDPTAFTDSNVPPFLINGPDIYAMLDRRRARAAKDKVRTLDDMIERSKLKTGKTIKETKNTFLSMMENLYLDADALAHNLMRYVAFRLESGSQPNENISNSTGQSELASTLNSKAASARDKMFTYKGVMESGGWMANSLKWIGGALKGITDSVQLEALGILVSGNGYFDIPDVWKSTSFSKTVSFDIQLRARAGDKISIFQSIYIPLAMLLCAASPRGIGESAYAQPFLLEAYSAGLYSIPLGIIESVSITRGMSEFGWTHEDLPTAVDVTVSIKDLTPVLFLSLLNATDGSVLDNVANANIGMMDYLNTLSGMNLADRTLRFKRLKRLRKTMFLIARNTVFNPMVYANDLGNSWAGKMKAGLDFKPYYTPAN